MKIKIYNNETIEDLQRAGFRMIQTSYGFRFGEDSVLLAALAASLYPGRKRLLAADLGAGCGSVSLLLAARMPEIRIWALELDSHRADCLDRNIKLNKLDARLRAAKIDLKNISGKESRTTFRDHSFEASSFDLVVANPPYRKVTDFSKAKWDSADLNTRSRLLAVEEIELSIHQLAASASRLLKPGGRFVVVHRPQRLPELLNAMQKFQLEPESLQVIESLPGKAPSRIIVIGRRQGRSGGFKWLKPLRICESPGVYTEEAKQLYGHEPSLTNEALWQNVERNGFDWGGFPETEQHNI